MREEAAATPVTLFPRWFSERIVDYFPEWRGRAVSWDCEAVKALADTWLARLDRFTDAAAQVDAGAWVVAYAWVARCSLEERFWSSWLSAAVASAEERGGRIEGVAASALALTLGGDPSWPLPQRMETWMALAALPSTVTLTPAEHDPLSHPDLSASSSELPVWGIAKGHSVRLIRWGEEGEEESPLYWFDFTECKRQIERLAQHGLQRERESAPNQGLGWLLLALSERLQGGVRRLFRHAVHESALIVVGWEGVAALGVGGLPEYVSTTVLDVADYALGVRLLLPTDQSEVGEGEIVALRMAGAQKGPVARWLLGVVRWCQKRGDGTVVGLQTLAPIAATVNLLWVPPDRKAGERQIGILLERWLPFFPQQTVALPRLDHLEGAWWLVFEPALYRTSVERFQPGRIRLVTPRVTVVEVWPKEA